MGTTYLTLLLGCVNIICFIPFLNTQQFIASACIYEVPGSNLAYFDWGFSWFSSALEKYNLRSVTPYVFKLIIYYDLTSSR